MEMQAFMKVIFHDTEENGKLEEYKLGFPIGQDKKGGVLLAQKHDKPLTIRNTCATGVGRTDFLRRLIITLSCLYEKEQACFFVLSPREEYGELLRLHSLDITVPYIHGKEDLDKAMDTLKELMRMRATGMGYPRLFVVLDGLEDLPDVPKNGELSEYRAVYEILSHKPGVDIFTGVDLSKSIFAGYPGVFLGIGNCLVTTHESGKADVTYVGEDSSLTLPTPMVYPNAPTVGERVKFLNAGPSM